MDFLLFLATFVLFFVLTPGVILSLPPKGSKLVTALVHALLFAVLLTLFMECFKMNYQENISQYGKKQSVGCEHETAYGSYYCTGRHKLPNLTHQLF